VTLRVAVDANVLIAGFGWPRWPYEVLRHAEQGDFVLVLSPIVIDEARNRIRRNLPTALEDFELFLAAVAYEEAPVPSQEEIATHRAFVRQAKDVPIALSIRAARVDYFVTYDRDFTDQDETTATVRQAIPGIILPPVFLRDVMGWTSEELETIRYREWPEMEGK
jgi:predicted nucleic acid-binding protein